MQEVTYESFKARLTREYMPEGIRETRRRAFLLQGYDPTVTIAQEIQRVRDGFILAGDFITTDAHRIELLYRRLPFSARSYISGFCCTSFSEYCDRLTRWEADRLASQAEGAGRQKRARGPEASSGRGQGVQQRRYDAPVRARAIAPPALPPPRQGSGQRSYPVQGQDDMADRMRSVTCYGCQEKGHYRSTCPFIDSTCRTCGRKGHRAPFCSQATGGGRHMIAAAQLEGPVSPLSLPPPPPRDF